MDSELLARGCDCDGGRRQVRRRVVRGGSWLSYDGITLAAEQYFEASSSRSYVVGFRVVRNTQ